MGVFSYRTNRPGTSRLESARGEDPDGLVDGIRINRMSSTLVFKILSPISKRTTFAHETFMPMGSAWEECGRRKNHSKLLIPSKKVKFSTQGTRLNVFFY